MAAAMKPLCLLVASGVLQRHPGLKFVLVECGIGWLAWVLQTLDEMHEKASHVDRATAAGQAQRLLPAPRRCNFGDDLVGLRMRDVTGVESLLWGSDYPHDEGTFPHSREVIERTFRDVPEEEKQHDCRGKCGSHIRLFDGLDRSASFPYAVSRISTICLILVGTGGILVICLPPTP